MGKHRVSLGRRGVAALAATGALVIGGTSAALLGTGSAAPLDVLPISSPATTTVLPDLAPFKDNGSKGAGKAEVSDEVGAPAGGGKAALRISTPGGDDKASYVTAVSGEAASLAAWIPTAAYSAYQLEAGNPIQFPSLQLIVDFNGTETGGFSTLTYEPVYNRTTDSLEPGQWNRYQAGTGRWCSTRAIPGVIDDTQKQCSNGGDKPLADYVAAAPDLVVQAVVINQGSGNPGLESAVDLVTTPTTTYDFELTKPAPPVVIPDPTDPTTDPTTPTTEPSEPTTRPEHPGQGTGGGKDDGQWGDGGKDHGQWGDGQGGHCTCG